MDTYSIIAHGYRLYHSCMDTDCIIAHGYRLYHSCMDTDCIIAHGYRQYHSCMDTDCITAHGYRLYHSCTDTVSILYSSNNHTIQTDTQCMQIQLIVFNNRVKNVVHMTKIINHKGKEIFHLLYFKYQLCRT